MLKICKINMGNKTKEIVCELKNHAPFTGLATVIAVLVVFLFFYLPEETISERAFHLSHFVHIVASAMVTAGIFYKHKPSVFTALLIGILGAVIIGSFSDIIFPYLGWTLLNMEIHFHFPLLEETFFVLLSALLGSLAGVFINKTKPPHFIHVFLSVFASLFYLLVFSPPFAPFYFVAAFFIVFVAVIIPCCLSDIIFPFFFINEKDDSQKGHYRRNV